MAETDRHGAWGWRQVALATLLALVMISPPLTSFALGALGPVIVTELGIGRAPFGLLSTIMFTVAALASNPAGRATDAAGGERLMVTGLGLAAAALVVIATARSYPALVAATCIGGLSVSISNPATNKTIMLRVQPAQQSVITGVKQAGVLGAGVVAGSVLPWGAAAVGWRWPLVWCALLPVSGIVLARVTLRATGRHGTPASQAPAPAARQPPGRAPARRVRARSRQPGGAERVPGLFWLRWYALAMGTGHLAVVIYLPLYAFEVGDLSAASAGFLTALLGIAGVCARIGLGAAGDRLGRPSTLLLWLALLSGASQLILWLSPAVGTAALWSGTLLFGATSGGWSGLGQVATLRAGGKRLAGTASGAVTRSYYIGFLASPAAFGYLLDLSGSYAPGWLLMTACSVLAVVGARRFAQTGEQAGR